MTLIELMIAVVIVALLAAVALPAYQGSVRKARRADAKAALTLGAQRMERLYTETGGYDTATVGAGTTDTVSSSSEQGYYAVSMPTRTRTAFTLRATPQGPQTGDTCGAFTLDQSGNRGVGGTLSVADCW